MINERQIDSNPYVKARGETQLRAKQAFERSSGWAFGLIFGLLVVLITYFWDTVQLTLVRAEFSWVRLVLALVTIVPLAVIAGGLAGHLNWVLKAGVWALFGVLSGWLAIRLPFDGARLVLQWIDSDLRLVEFLPTPEAAASSFWMLATLGALLGVIVGLLQTLAINWAWEWAGEAYRLTLGGWALFLVTLPIAFAYAVLFDGATQSPLRAPMVLVNSVVSSGLNDAPDQDHRQMEIHRGLVYLTGQRWRTQISPDYRMHLAASEPSLTGESYVDVSFSNGFLLRCRVTTFGEFTGSCNDLQSDYREYISAFVSRGGFECKDCEGQIASEAAEWQRLNSRALSPADTVRFTHGAGSIVKVQVESPGGAAFECLFWGANPVIIEKCNPQEG